MKLYFGGEGDIQQLLVQAFCQQACLYCHVLILLSPFSNHSFHLSRQLESVRLSAMALRAQWKAVVPDGFQVSS